MFKEIPATKRSTVRRKPILGIATNDAHYITEPTINGKRIRCHIYTTWRHMLGRCYCESTVLDYPTYTNCIVTDEWLKFSNFREWVLTQDWKNKDLDKDILVPNNKIYSPQFCIFVSTSLNNLILDSAKIRGAHPQGVDFLAKRKKFRAVCKVKGKQVFLGYFDTSEEASEVYKKFKSDLIIQTANEQTDVRIKKGLLKHAELLLTS